jgi:iron-sulfur cluster repair protein YtfE (RIC family)
MCKLLQADVEKALIELSLEKFQVEQLERAQGDQPDSLKELVVLLKNSPKNIVEELNKEEGLLAKVLELGKETQVK